MRDSKGVTILSKSGLDWTWRFSWIVEAATRLRLQRFVIDGEIASSTPQSPPRETAQGRPENYRHRAIRSWPDRPFPVRSRLPDGPRGIVPSIGRGGTGQGRVTG